MKIQIVKKVGKAQLTFVVEGNKEVDALSSAAAYTGMPDTCGLCQSEDVELTSNKAEGFTFVKVKCLKCNARSQMGQYKDNSGVFWKNWEKYEAPGKRDTSSARSKTEAQAEEDEMDF